MDPIDPALVSAFRATDYAVDAPDGPFVLRIDAPSAPLAARMRAAGVRSAALLTAHNPGSRPTSAADNATAQRALDAALAAHGAPVLPTRAIDPSGAWPVEPGRLALGLPFEAALALARRFGQLAFVWIDAPDAACTLAFAREAGDDAPAGPVRAAHDPRGDTMSVEFIDPPGVPRAGYSHVAVVGGGARTIFVSGQVALDAQGRAVDGFEAQLEQVFDNLERALAAAGATLAHVVKMNGFVVGLDAERTKAFREVRGRRFGTHRPASTLVGTTALVMPELLVEVEVVAVVD